MGRRHLDVDDRDVGRACSRPRAAAPRPSRALPTTSKPASAEQPREALAQQHLVVGDHDAHGSSARTVVAVRRVHDRELPSSAPTRSSRSTSVGRRAAVELDDADAPSRAAARAPRARRARAARRLGDDEVGGGLDGAGERSSGSGSIADRARRRLGERLERGREPLVGEHRREDAVRELAQLGERGAQLGLGLVERRGARLVAPRSARSSRSASESATSRCCAPSWRSRSSRRRSASPASTMRAREARSSLELRARLGLQPLVLEREPRGGGDLLEPAPGRRAGPARWASTRDLAPAAHQRRDRRRELASSCTGGPGVDAAAAVERVGERERGSPSASRERSRRPPGRASPSSMTSRATARARAPRRAPTPEATPSAEQRRVRPPGRARGRGRRRRWRGSRGRRRARRRRPRAPRYGGRGQQHGRPAAARGGRRAAIRAECQRREQQAPTQARGPCRTRPALSTMPGALVTARRLRGQCVQPWAAGSKTSAGSRSEHADRARVGERECRAFETGRSTRPPG